MDLLILIGVINMKLAKEELMYIKGGAITSAMITSLVRLIGVVIDFGRMVGTSIRRGIKRDYC